VPRITKRSVITCRAPETTVKGSKAKTANAAASDVRNFIAGVCQGTKYVRGKNQTHQEVRLSNIRSQSKTVFPIPLLVS
jgi:hypothetical protein